MNPIEFPGRPLIAPERACTPVCSDPPLRARWPVSGQLEPRRDDAREPADPSGTAAMRQQDAGTRVCHSVRGKDGEQRRFPISTRCHGADAQSRRHGPAAQVDLAAVSNEGEGRGVPSGRPRISTCLRGDRPLERLTPRRPNQRAQSEGPRGSLARPAPRQRSLGCCRVTGHPP